MSFQYRASAMMVNSAMHIQPGSRYSHTAMHGCSQVAGGWMPVFIHVSNFQVLWEHIL